MPGRMAGSASIQTSSWTGRRRTGRTRCGCRAATVRRIPIAILEAGNRLAVARLRRAWLVPWPEPGDGLAVRGGTGPAPAESPRGAAGAAADGGGARTGDRAGGG